VNDAVPGAYTRFGAAAEIAYTPEEALREGLHMVSTIRAGIRTLELGNKMRSDVWMREIERCASSFSMHVRVGAPLMTSRAA
jgi:hypothetical protein